MFYTLLVIINILPHSYSKQSSLASLILRYFHLVGQPKLKLRKKKEREQLREEEERMKMEQTQSKSFLLSWGSRDLLHRPRRKSKRLSFYFIFLSLGLILL